MFDLKFMKLYLAFISGVINYDINFQILSPFYKVPKCDEVYVKEMTNIPIGNDVFKRNIELLNYFNLLDKYIRINNAIKNLRSTLVSFS